MIDETDAATDNALFLQFLGLLRSKYLARNEGEDSTFHSVVLAGVHDVKNIEQYSSKDTAFVEKLAASTAPDCNRQSL